MKIKTVVLLIACFSGSAFADNNVTLNKVTLFLKGAELEGESRVSLKKGENQLVLTNIANGTRANSINVGFDDNDVRVLSTSLNKNYIDNKQNDDAKPLLEKLKQLQEKYDNTEIQLQATTEQVTLLRGNHLELLSKGANSNVTELKNMLEFIKTNLITALSEEYKLQKEIDQLKEQILKCQEEITNLEESTKNSTNAINVTVYSNKDITLPIRLSYVTNVAGWSPAYEVRVDDINSPMYLTYKADIYQNSGLDWKDVDFILSTSNPSKGITAPFFLPWYIETVSSKGYKKLAADVVLDDSNRYRSYSNQVNSNVNNVTVNTLGINTIFKVNLPNTIKSNSKNNMLTLQTKEVEAKYQYVALPKLDNGVYLQAKVADWEKLNLLPGKLTVFFAGNYIGESSINTEDLPDTLDIALGHDKNIYVSRDRNVNETSKPSFFGNDITQKYAYTIDVKNAKSLPIDIMVYDQLPVIRDKIISLNDTKYDGAEYDQTTGKLSWQLKLNPSESKTLNLSFKLTYPKDRVDDIIGL